MNVIEALNKVGTRWVECGHETDGPIPCPFCLQIKLAAATEYYKDLEQKVRTHWLAAETKRLLDERDAAQRALEICRKAVKRIVVQGYIDESWTEWKEGGDCIVDSLLAATGIKIDRLGKEVL